ncbi:MAG: hypothetical protein IRY83_11555 [Chloroflexi bacterium]|nr:hypothetical protein [Chloroflexota bacterium]
MLMPSPTLLAAQKAADGEPIVTAVLADVPPGAPRLTDLSPVSDLGLPDVAFDAWITPDLWLGRIRADAGGGVWVQIVPLPDGPFDGWDCLTAAGGLPDGPVAIARHVDGFWRAFFVAADGHVILEAARPAAGGSWSVPAPALDAGAGFLVTGLATNGHDPVPRLFYAVSGGQLFAVSRAGGAWGAAVADGGTYLGSPQLGCDYFPPDAPGGDGRTYVVVAYGQPDRLTLRGFDGVWGPAVILRAAASGSGYHYSAPFLAAPRADQRWACLSWIETAPDPPGPVPILAWTPTPRAITHELPFPSALPAGQTAARGLKVFRAGGPSAPDGRAWWWFVTGGLVYAAPADDAAAEGARLAFPADAVVDLRLDQPEPNRPARLQLTVLNPDGRYADAGQPGPHRAIREWSRLTVRIGYRTAAGVEQIALPPAWVESVVFHDDAVHGVPLMTIHAADAWGLLDRLVVRTTRTFTDATLDQILAWIWQHVCGDLNLAPPPVLTAISVPSFALKAGETMGDAARRLLELAGAVMRFRTRPEAADGMDEDTVGVEVIPWAGEGPDAAYVYGGPDGHPILSARLAPIAVPSATAVQVIGASSVSLRRNLTAARALSHEIVARVVNQALETRDRTDAAAAGLAALVLSEARGGELTAPAHVGLEIGDRVVVRVPTAPGGAVGLSYTAAGLLTSWSREHGLVQTLRLEGTG